MRTILAFVALAVLFSVASEAATVGNLRLLQPSCGPR